MSSPPAGRPPQMKLAIGDRPGPDGGLGRFLLKRIVVVAATLLLGAGPASAQIPEKVHRLAALLLSPRSLEQVRAVTLPELGKLGFVEGRNLAVDVRVGPPEHLPALAREVVARRPDVILAVSSEAIEAAWAATGTIPIVMYGGDSLLRDPDTSLSRPSGNATGIVILGAELDTKRLEFLHEAVPAARRLAALVLAISSPLVEARKQMTRTAAAAAGVELVFFDAAGTPAGVGTFLSSKSATRSAVG
jgi:putative tryptophan/tyrosine transport system substrate-binding protein